MTPKILVTGGTGTLGRQVAAQLLDRGAAVRILSRGEHASGADTEYVRGDLASGEGLTAAVSGVGTVVHCASSRTGDACAARNLVRVAAGSSVSHVVYISIVGSDVITMGYYRAKVEAERAIVESGLPWTTLRATQFFELLLKGAKPMSKLPVIPVPAGFRTQPVDSAEVAARLTDLALIEPAFRRVADLGGPEVLSFAEVIRTYLAAVGKRRPVVPVWLPGTAGIRAGRPACIRPAGRPAAGQRTWAEFLAARTA